MGADQAIWWGTILTVFYTAGLRQGEALHLTWQDVDFSTDTIRVTAKAEGVKTLRWAPKDYESREIPMPPETMTMLARLQAIAPHGHPYVFLPTERLQVIQAAQAAKLWREKQSVVNNFHRQFRRIVEVASKKCATLLGPDGKPTIGVHDLRRSAITNWSKLANIQTVMAMAGHSDVETTRKYYAAATDDQLALVRKASQAALKSASSAQTDPKVTPKAKSRLEKRSGSGTKCLSGKKLPP